ncbi:MAG: phage tail sheath subtilisin-like domain-containing protein [Bacilli bacterium]
MLLSPGIETKESSLQTTVVNTSTGRAATVGKFNWGPAFEIAQVVSEVDLVDRFSTPDDATADSFFSAANFLKYGNDLRLVRIVDADTAKNSSALFDMVEVTIAAGGTGYKVGDIITVKYSNSVIEATGKVTAIGTSGAITKYHIPSRMIVAKAKEVGTYPMLGSEFTLEITSPNGGSSASLTAPKLIHDSKIYFPNDSDSSDAILAPDGVNPAAKGFKTYCEMFDVPLVAARFPGEYGTGITVDIASFLDYQTGKGTVTLPLTTGGTRTVNFRSIMPYGPQTIHEFAMIVRRGNEVLETAVLSTRAGDKDIYGNSIYVDDYFRNGNSRYLSGSSESWPTNYTGTLVLGGGNSGNVQDNEDKRAGPWINGWDLFADRYFTPVNLLIAGSCAGEGAKTASTVQKHVSDLARERQDCLAFISPPREYVVNKISAEAVDKMIDWRRGSDSQGQPVENNMNISNTYSTIDGNYKFMYDKYSDINRWVPLSADIAGLCARTDVVAQPWMSPAGFNRGQIQGVIKLAIDTRQSHRDRLYQESINPVVSFAGQGVILYGDKTASSEPSPFDRINVRRLFNLIKVSIGNSAQYKLFELNDAFTQMSFRTETNSYMDTIRSLGGCYDFRVVCDGSNNTPSVIDRNEFVATVLVKPARSINFITLNFVATSTGADFDEIVGKA